MIGSAGHFCRTPRFSQKWGAPNCNAEYNILYNMKPMRDKYNNFDLSIAESLMDLQAAIKQIWTAGCAITS